MTVLFAKGSSEKWDALSLFAVVLGWAGSDDTFISTHSVATEISSLAVMVTCALGFRLNNDALTANASGATFASDIGASIYTEALDAELWQSAIGMV